MTNAGANEEIERGKLSRQLHGLNSRDRLFDLFTGLNYDYVGEPLPKIYDEANNAPLVAELAVAASAGDFHVIYARMTDDRLSKGRERRVVNALIEQHPYSLFVFADKDCKNWHFVNPRTERGEATESRINRRILRRISVSENEQLRTATERLSLIEVSAADKQAPLRVAEKVERAFDVEKVTQTFFNEYQQIFRGLQDYLNSQVNDLGWAHDYALQLLNRLMFVYFIQRRPEQWLGPKSKDFIQYLWQQYTKAGRPKDTFYREWLALLFFDAFAREPGFFARPYMPADINEAIALAPYLNGGLFNPNRLDSLYSGDFSVADAQIERIIAFFQRYNFTIAEDSPFDQEVAVDPEMIGKVYESLVNSAEQSNERGEAGIFYTPRTEIDLMCRLTLVEYLYNHLSEHSDAPKGEAGQRTLRDLLYNLIFAYERDEKNAADERLFEAGWWAEVAALLRAVTVLDPACGSGAFLVGMLTILYDLNRRASKYAGGHPERAYDLKRRIIGDNLYGVDVKEWAVDVAELRLWLQLIVDTEFQREELTLQPLLPNLSFKVRAGDSLVQEVGGLNLSLRHSSVPLSPSLKAKLTLLKSEKLKYYNNVRERKYRTLEDLQNAELDLFREILSDRSEQLAKQAASKRHALQDLRAEQQTMFDTGTSTADPAIVKRLTDEATELDRQRGEVIAAGRALVGVRDIPFVWDVAFVEVFEGEKAGFDIVVGNPPYVRQEMITDQTVARSRQNLSEVKQFYKTKLMRSVYALYPDYFGYNAIKDTATLKLDAKSDLYVYFYFHALALLNQRGAFAFITSNSWLDVGYGAELQEFMLRRLPIHMIIDNQKERSFANADVNTVIVLLGAPQPRSNTRLDHTARFVMFTVPFEQALSPIIFREIEESSGRASRAEYRLYAMSQAELLQRGTPPLEAEDEEEAAPTKSRAKLKSPAAPRYSGDKWGGKYLRAPDIYFKILDRAGDRLVPLGKIADVRFGIKTGANEFFYLEDITAQADERKLQQHGLSASDTATLRLCRNASGYEAVIEAEYLRPVVKSPREVKSIVIDPAQLRWQVLLCHSPRPVLKGKRVLQYIEWGEAQNFDERPSTASRPRWWDLGVREPALVNCNYLVDRVMRFYYSNTGVFVSDNFQEIHTPVNSAAITIAMNSAVQALFLNMLGRTNFGGGLLKIQTYEVAQLLCLRPDLLPNASEHLAKIIGLGFTDSFASPGRQELDRIVLEAIGLGAKEQEELYEAVTALVRTRLDKAKTT